MDSMKVGSLDGGKDSHWVTMSDPQMAVRKVLHWELKKV